MKKISIVFLSLLTLFLITGCGTTEENKKTPEEKEQQLICTATENDEGMSTEQVISMTYKGNKLKHMTMEVNVKISDSDVQQNWEAFKETMDKNNQEFDKDGVSLKIETDDQKYEYKTILDIDVENASKEALEEQGFSDLKDDESTLEDSKESAEQDGFTCEVK